MIADNRIWFGEDGNNVPAIKRFLTEVKQGVACQTIWKYEEVGHSQDGKKELKRLFPEGIPFDTPKPTSLLKRMVKIAGDADFIALDFFSGSATTADAIMQMNAEDGRKRKFIMVQYPEKCNENSSAYNTGYGTITEVGKERIRRAGKKLMQEVTSGSGNVNGEGFGCGMPSTKEEWDYATKHVLDIGFRVLKLADSNMNDVYYSADEYDQTKLDGMDSNTKPDRTDLDLLFGCLLEWGLPLSLPYKSETIDGCTVHTYAPGDPDLEIRDALIACFDEAVPTNVIETIARRNPLRAVFREECFTSSPGKINVFETFKRLAQGTAVKVI